MTGWLHQDAIRVRLRAFLTHFLISFCIVSGVLTLVLLLWYPKPYFYVFDATDVIKVLIAVDLVLGPALTLVLYKPGKQGLWFDMTCVALLQVSALAYGTSVIYGQRPYYAVFVADRFEIMARNEIDESTITQPELRNKVWAEPIFAVAEVPTDPQAYRQLIEEVIFDGQPDIDRRPEFWRPYADGRDLVWSKARTVGELTAGQPALQREVQDLQDEYGADLRYVPVMGKSQSFAFVLHPDTRRPLHLLKVDPWEAGDKTGQQAAGAVAQNDAS